MEWHRYLSSMVGRRYQNSNTSCLSFTENGTDGEISFEPSGKTTWKLQVQADALVSHTYTIYYNNNKQRQRAGKTAKTKSLTTEKLIFR